MGAHEVERLRELDVSEEGDIVYKWVGGEDGCAVAAAVRAGDVDARRLRGFLQMGGR
jgi:hypothetical protein